MKAILFCRVSSKDQEDTGYSLPAQEKYLTDFADKQGLIVEKIFAVSESAGGKTQRKIFNEMIEYINKNKISSIVVETTDRLTRNFKDVPTIDKWILDDETHQIYLAKEGCILEKNSRSHEWFMWRVKVATAEYYVRLLSENVKKGQKEKIAQGWLPSKPKLGYKNLDVNGHLIHVIDDTYAPFVKKAFQLYITGVYSVQRLSELLYKEGLRTRMGNKLNVARLYDILTDPFYIGVNIWNNKEYTNAKHEPIISKEIFQKVQQKLKSKTTTQYQKHRYLFQGLIRCGECGYSITWEMQKGTNYGHCTRYKPCSQNKWVRENDLEDQILFALELLEIKNKRIMEWIRKALHYSNEQMLTYQNTAFDELNKRLKAVNKRLSNLYDDKVDGVISIEFYTQKSGEYKQEKETIEASIHKHSTAGDKFKDMGITLYEVSQKAKEFFLKKAPDKKRLLLGLIFAKLELKDRVLTYEYTKAFKMLSKLAKITNESSELVQKEEKIKQTSELNEKTVASNQIANFVFLHSEVRRGRDSNSRSD